MRFDRRQARRLDAVRKAQWELRSGKKFTPEAARNKDALAAAPPLAESDLAERRTFLDQQVAATVWLRGFRYLLGCAFCQTFWAATLCFAASSVFAASSGLSWLDWIPTCMGYAGVSLWLPDGRNRGDGPDSAPGCGRTTGHEFRGREKERSDAV